jgi:hypothetical protein
MEFKTQFEVLWICKYILPGFRNNGPILMETCVVQRTINFENWGKKLMKEIIHKDRQKILKLI